MALVMRLADWLKRNKLSGEVFGKRIGVSQVAVSRYARGTRMPQPEVMEHIYLATGGQVQPGDFYRLEDFDVIGPPEPSNELEARDESAEKPPCEPENQPMQMPVGLLTDIRLSIRHHRKYFNFLAKKKAADAALMELFRELRGELTEDADTLD